MSDTDALTALAARLADFQDRKNQIDNEEMAVKAAILTLTNGPNRYAAGPLTIIITQARNIDKAALAAKYPVDVHPELYDTVVSVKKVRAVFAPVDLEPFEMLSSPSVKLA